MGTDVDTSLLGPIISEQEAMTDDGLSVMGAAQDTPEVTIRIRKKQARTFGGFAGMVGVSSTQGRIRGAHWTVACIAQIYADKVSARQALCSSPVQRSRQTWCQTQCQM